MSSESGIGKASDGGHALICRFCPAEGFWLLVVGGDELPDRGFQFLNASTDVHDEAPYLDIERQGCLYNLFMTWETRTNLALLTSSIRVRA